MKKMAQFAIGPIGGGFFSLITLPLIAWHFPVEAVGRLAMLQVSVSFSVMFFSLAMHQAYVREYNECEEGCRGALLRVSVVPGFVLLSVATILYWFAPFFMIGLLFEETSVLISFLFFVSVVLHFFINFGVHVLRMQERALVYSLIQIFRYGFLLAAVGIIIICDLKDGFTSLIVSFTASAIILFCGVFFALMPSWKSALSSGTDVKLMLNMLKFSMPLVVGGFAYWGLTAMDRFFLMALSGFEELGVYSLAISLSAAVTVLSMIFSSIWHPTVYAWIKNGIEPERVQSVIENMLLLVVCVWTFVGIFSWLCLYFIPSGYESLEFLLVAGIAMPLFYMLSEATVVGIGISRKTSFAMIASLSAFVVNGVLNAVLIPEHGSSGAAIASAVSFFIFFVMRTEASACLWVSLPRIKIYIVLIGYLSATILMTALHPSGGHFFVIWLMLFFLSVALFRDRVFKSFVFVYNFRRGGL